MPLLCPNCDKPVPEAKPGTRDLVCPHCANVFDAPSPDGEVGRLAPGDELGGFQIIRHIASGGMGEVYLARQVSLQREVALKTLSNKYTNNPEVVQRFLLEVRATASLEHPNIVTLFEAGKTKGICFLAMAFVDGISLDRLLEKQERLDEREALRIVHTIAEALDYAWRKQKLLHRDIKPANIMLDRQGQVRLLDLGIAKRPNDDFQLTRRGIASGTPHYMSPEQARGQDDLDFRSDMYALGATLFHLVTGSFPFDAPNMVEVLTKHLSEPLRDPRELNHELSDGAARLIRIMMAKNRDDRHSSWQWLLRDVDRVLDGELPGWVPGTSGEPDQMPETQSWLVRWRDYALGAGADRRQRASRYRIAGFSLILLLLVAWLLVSVLRAPPAPSDDAAGFARPRPPRPAASDGGAAPAPLPSPTTALSEAATEEELRRAIEKAIDEGKSPLDLLKRSTSAPGTHLERLAWMLINEYEGPRRGWAAGAVRELIPHYRRTGDKAQLEKILRRAIEMSESNAAMRSSDLPSLYRELAELLFAAKRAKEAEDLLWEAMKRNPDGRHQVAGNAAFTLFNHYKTKDEAKLAEVLTYALQNFPDGTPKLDDLRTYAKEKQPILVAAVDAAKLDREVKARREKVAEQTKPEREQLAAESDRGKRAALLLGLGKRYFDEGLPEDALSYYQDVHKNYADVNEGEAAAQALRQITRCHQKLGNTAAWVDSLDRQLTKDFRGRDGQYGLEAARQLAAYYAKNNEMMRLTYLRRIMDDFPGPDGSGAAEAGLELAKYYEQSKRPALAGDTLIQVRARYPGRERVYAKRAETELLRLAKLFPQEVRLPADMTPPAAQQLFADAIALNGIGDFLKVRETGVALSVSKEVTVEAWVNLAGSGAGQQYVLSRYGNNQRGFNLYLDGGLPVWEVFDGARNYVLRAAPTGQVPTGRWTHLAATVGPGQMALFVNGQRVAVREVPKVENDGAGHLVIGRCSWQASGYFNGRVQNILVYTSQHYRGLFDPPLKPTPAPDLFLAVVAAAPEPKDLLGRHKVETTQK